MQQLGISQENISVKKVHKGINATCSHLYEIPRRKNYADSRAMAAGIGAGDGKGLSEKRHKKNFESTGNVLYLDFGCVYMIVDIC